MLKKIIKTHTARLDFVDFIKITFFKKRYRLRTVKDGFSLIALNVYGMGVSY